MGGVNKKEHDLNETGLKLGRYRFYYNNYFKLI